MTKYKVELGGDLVDALKKGEAKFIDNMNHIGDEFKALSKTYSLLSIFSASSVFITMFLNKQPKENRVRYVKELMSDLKINLNDLTEGSN